MSVCSRKIQLFSLKITAEFNSQISKQTHCKMCFNTCGLDITLLLIIKTKPCSGVTTIYVPESDFSDGSCTTLDPLHNFGNVSSSLWLH